MSLNLPKVVAEYLKSKPEQKQTAREIAKALFILYPNECQEKKNRSVARVSPLTTDDDLIQQIVAEIGSIRPSLQLKNPNIKTTESRPRKFYYSEISDVAAAAASSASTSEISDVKNSPTVDGKVNLTEQDLYPKLSNFLWAELNLYSKRIDERRSINSKGSGGNHWLYPDLFAIENLGRDWHREIKDCVQEIADTKTRLWSFEVKKLINRSNVREHYFQSVSNSSWANFGYLVAAEIEGDETMKELRMLSGIHGIGVIELNAEDPTESQITIPARLRSDVDWNTANRLATENTDFMNCIKKVRQFYQTGELNDSDWDIPEVLS